MLRLPPPRFVSAGWLRVLMLIFALAASILLSLGVGEAPQDPDTLLLFGGISLAVFLIALAAALLRRPKEGVELVADADGLLLPDPFHPERHERVTLDAVTTLEVLGRGKRHALLFATRQKRYFYALGAAPNSALEFITAVRAKIAARGGRMRLDAHDRQAELRRLFIAKPTPCTRALTIILLALFGAELATNSLTSFGLVRLGANAPVLVSAGQLERLITANFLHASVGHILMNVIALVTLGGWTERFLGPSRFILIYLGSCVAGSISSALVMPGLLSVGASTGIFGLLGSLAYMQWSLRDRLPEGLKLPRSQWLWTLAINAFLPIVVPQIDAAAHVGGFFAGAILTWALSPTPTPGKVAATGGSHRVAAGLALALVVASFGVTAYRNFRPDLEDDGRFIDEARTVLLDPANLNNMAWEIAEDPGATPDLRKKALAAAERALALAPDEPEVLDTVATLHYQLGDLERAIEVARRALARHPGSPYAEKLEQFEEAARKRGLTP